MARRERYQWWKLELSLDCQLAKRIYEASFFWSCKVYCTFQFLLHNYLKNNTININRLSKFIQLFSCLKMHLTIIRYVTSKKKQYVRALICAHNHIKKVGHLAQGVEINVPFEQFNGVDLKCAKIVNLTSHNRLLSSVVSVTKL